MSYYCYWGDFFGEFQFRFAEDQNFPAIGSDDWGSTYHKVTIKWKTSDGPVEENYTMEYQQRAMEFDDYRPVLGRVKESSEMNVEFPDRSSVQITLSGAVEAISEAQTNCENSSST